ncbi:MAG: FKBP-type peptidyl-prolyl cis-trans isomerase [Hahellaceae bacterium]|nr:FKBP-type peptidyl-prolyl cis-trans isomerase [Hahellaceae bacterium]
MKKSLVALGIGLAMSLNVLAETKEPAAPSAPDMKDVGYSFGHTFGQRLKDSMPGLDMKSFMEGLEDVYGDKPSRLTEEQMAKVMQDYQVAMQAEQQAAMQKMADENREKGKTYLTENGKKTGVVTTESGLQYKVLNKGKGESPKATDTVEVHYTGSLISGEVFDSSVERGEPVTFPVNGVIKGWIEALQLMKPGDKWQLAIPSDLAYGPNGTPNGRIGPNETLLFDVELLSIKKK